MVFALKHYSISLEDMPKEHVFLHTAKLCAINSLNGGVYFGVRVVGRNLLWGVLESSGFFYEIENNHKAHPQ